MQKQVCISQKPFLFISLSSKYEKYLKYGAFKLKWKSRLFHSDFNKPLKGLNDLFHLILVASVHTKAQTQNFFL